MMRRPSWQDIDFVGLGVNVVVGVLLMGGLVGTMLGPPSEAAGAEGLADTAGPVPPPLSSIESSDMCLSRGRLVACDPGDADEEDLDDREDRRGSNQGRH